MTPLSRAFERELDEGSLVDRAGLFAMATGLAASRPPEGLGALLFIDVPLWARAEREFVNAMAARAPAVLATIPQGDELSLTLFQSSLGVLTKGLEEASRPPASHSWESRVEERGLA